MIKVSIIVPVYNSEKYLEKCIKSLTHQTEKDIEIILVNDGSNDNSEKIIKKYKDKRIKYISKNNEGIGKTRNTGIKEAKGEYLMFIDSDDYVDTKCVKVMYEAAKNNKSDLVISNFYKDYNGKLEKISIPSFESSSLKKNPNILNYVNMGPCNKLFKRTLLKNIRFDEENKYEDVLFVCKSLINAKKIVHIDDYLSYYVIHSNSETTTRDKKIFDILEVNKKLYKICKNESYLKTNFINLTVSILTDYAAQTRYIKDKSIRHTFIKRVFKFLNSIDKKWYKCDYFMNLNIISRIIKSHERLLMLYCDVVGIVYRIRQ